MEFPVTTRLGIEIADGCGYHVRSSDGREYLDFYGGHAVASLGYRHPALTRAISAQAEKLVFQSNASDLEVRRKACDAIASVAPSGIDAVFLVNSGAEANETALRLAFAQTKRSQVVALRGAFHGRTAAAAAVTHGNEAWYSYPAKPFDVLWVEPNDQQGLLRALSVDVAAFIFEPVQGVAGAVSLDVDFLSAARTACTEKGVVMIADEVQTGVGRTGSWFAVERCGIVPDLLTTSKGLGGGFPVAAVLGRSEVAEKTPVGFLGTTFGGGPMACAAVLAVIEEVGRPGFLSNVDAMSKRLVEECVIGPVKRVSGRGLLLGLHCDIPAAVVRARLLELGVLTGDAKDPNVVRILPPLVIDDIAVNAFVGALSKVGE